MKHSTSTFAWAALIAVGLLAGGCGGGGGGGDDDGVQPATVRVLDPAVDLTAAPEGVVTVEYVDDGDPATARTSLVGDRDGDPSTLGDQVEIARNRPVQPGVTQRVVWELAGVPPGTYSVIGIADDGVNVPETDAAPGQVTVDAVSFVAHAGGAVQDEAFAVAARTDGGSFVAGNIRDGAIFGEGEPGETTVTAAGIESFVARYAPDGSLVWVRAFGGEGNFNQAGRDVAVTPDGGCVVVGNYVNETVLGEGEANETTLPALPDTGSSFVARFDPNGSLAWAKHGGGSVGTKVGQQVVVLPNGDLVVAGDFRPELVLGIGEPAETTLTAVGLADLFLARFRGNGTLVWARGFGSTKFDRVGGLALQPDGSILVFGRNGEAMTLGTGEPNQTTIDTGGGFLAAYTPDGRLIRARSLVDTGDALEPTGLAVFSDGSFVAVATFQETITLDPDGPAEQTIDTLDDNDMLIMTFAADLRLQTVLTAGGDGEDDVNEVTCLADDSFVLTGAIDFDCTFGGGTPQQTILQSSGEADMVLARYRRDGRLLFARAFGSTLADRSHGVDADPAGSLFVCGGFSGTAKFDTGTTRTSNGTLDIVLLRFHADGFL